MSTNPFRRSSLKGPSASSGVSETTFIASAPIAVSDSGADTPTPLSVNTKGSASTQKHVNFASPPAVGISPISYPPSPESTRLSPEFYFARPVAPSPIDYSAAIQSDPFRAEAETDADDGVIEQALENAKINNTLAAPALETSKQDAVRNTLSRFASIPKRSTATMRDTENRQASAPSRQTMDVEAFKRLLLTGDSGNKQPQEESGGSFITTPVPQGMHDNGSTTDTASISQRSLFDQMPANEESPRSSAEVDPRDVDHVRQSLANLEPAEGRRKPPPPIPKYGKLVKDDAASDPPSEPASPQIASANLVSKQPPAPPLTRRRSQNSNTAPATPIRRLSGETDVSVNSNAVNSSPRVAPPPPRARRPVASNERRASSDLPPTAEESGPSDSSPPFTRKTSDSRPPLPPARNSSKRVSVGTMNPPPLPPPRRGRGSSRSSVDSQRPSLAVILDSDGVGAASEEGSTSESNSRRVSSNSNANDILANLAALQREVDAARRNVSR